VPLTLSHPLRIVGSNHFDHKNAVKSTLHFHWLTLSIRLFTFTQLSLRAQIQISNGTSLAWVECNVECHDYRIDVLVEIERGGRSFPTALSGLINQTNQSR
jgi:hypothetical protein